ncbi:adenosylcobinamide-GDP ribazoletransferase [Lactobacillus jensenii]|jgi:hypothetical protein|uniref:Adenosylcobinamide-GDP ribazoletransferase n=1 Tax=Lactobacillus jensenii TaxID=109790 RepID=A0A5N1IGI7_LACJE|nr:hypothetical protein [Lactobacillus jensenii]EEQ68870.1 hypothetical protein LBJG_01298 [Lactobacillus jensenii 1153]ERJ44743.1 adenosylcobinamide-GDP ribazoletransferase [Lactobacillus jensenii MD IIE-70(2)]APT14572.1 adenosylcobinamide-GDP ribazoletransferase [Lactobacillus jensenii]EEQ24866.1 hypothetical protein LACJE0001_0733 [Lactobacillus jensenii 269-3]EEX27856.1 hypothetical protein HMPREF0527_00091 [Lactobacillus jensenii SJ-7A-US]
MKINQYQIGHLVNMLLLALLILRVSQVNLTIAILFVLFSIIPSYYLLGQAAKKKMYLVYLQMLWDIILFSGLYFFIK